jgi:hypothetical protein
MVGMIGGGGISMGGGAGIGGGEGTSGGGGDSGAINPDELAASRLQEVDNEMARIRGILNSNEDYANLADAIRSSEKDYDMYKSLLERGLSDPRTISGAMQFWKPALVEQTKKLTALRAYQANIEPDLQWQLRRLQREKESLENQLNPPFESGLIPDYTLHLLAAGLFPKPGAVAAVAGPAQITINREVGLAAQTGFAQWLRAAGFKVVGERIWVRTPLGLREMDIVVRDAAGELHAIEVKSGTAELSAHQLAKNRYINKFGAKAVGERAKKAGICDREIKSVTTVKVP